MTGRGRLQAWVAIVTTVLAGSCDSGPKAGEIVAELTTPHTELGAAAFRVTALDPYSIESVTAACTGCRVFPLRVSTGEMRGVVTGRFSAGPLLRVLVSDRDVQGVYSATLMELAVPTSDLVGVHGSSLSFPVK